MSVESAPRYDVDNTPENHEYYQAMGFEEYRELCDRTDFFRKLGVMDKVQYDKAIGDPQTSFLIKGSEAIPVLMPLEYEDRYNEGLSKNMTDSDEVYLLSLPYGEVLEAVQNGATVLRGMDMGENFSIIVEDYNKEGLDDEQKAKLARALDMLGDLVPGEFVDERLKDMPTNRTAWMSIYDFVMDSNKDPGEMLHEGAFEERAVQAWEQYRQEKGIPELPDETFNGNFFFSADQLHDHPEIVNQLWDISKVGFGNNLGKYHPISMAVTKHFFDRHVTSEGTFVCARYSEGEPMCFGFVAPSMNHNEWLNEESTTLKELTSGSKEGEEMVVHFFELISKGERGLGLAPALLTLLQDLASRMSQKTRVVFESTNLSDVYIPTIAQATAEENPAVTLERPVEKLDTLHYWYLKNQ